MTALILAAALSPAFAGYGDVVAGYPNANERALHLWTNAARVAPAEFEAYYDCSMDVWQDYEKVAQTPISMDYDLVEAARFHSDDMKSNNHFAHESSDGTSFADRMARFYASGFVGENIAAGYPDEFDAVFGGWMCSDGHRANIMLPEWVELGTGVVGTYYTQDFGGGEADTTAPVVMGTHWPIGALASAELLADWHDAEPPARMLVIVDGRAEPMSLEHGAADMGIYMAEVDHDDAGCHTYFFAWETAAGDQGTFPEDGSYLYGEGCADAYDEAAAADGWVTGQAGEWGDGVAEGGGSGGGDIDLDDIALVGCAVAPAPLTGGLALFGLGLVAARRREG